MLAKKARLTTSQFNQYFKDGKRFYGTYVQVVYTPLSTFHGSVVVGKKVSKKAVDRNRLRRRLYGVLYQLHKRDNLSGVHVVLVKPTALKTEYTAVRSELETLIGRIHKNTIE